MQDFLYFFIAFLFVCLFVYKHVPKLKRGHFQNVACEQFIFCTVCYTLVIHYRNIKSEQTITMSKALIFYVKGIFCLLFHLNLN